MQRFALVRILTEESPRWSEVAAAYLIHGATYKSPTTLRGVDKPAIKSLTDFIGDPRVGEITRQIAEAWVASLKLSAASRRTRIIAARCVFRYAVEESLIEKNPFAHIRLPPPHFAGRALTDGEIKIFLAHVGEPYRSACRFALYTGMRRKEIVGLRWRQIGDESVTILSTLAKSKRERFLLLSPKARACLGPRLPGQDAPVFRFGVHGLNDAVTKAWRAAGIGKIRFHDLRHTWATRRMELSDDLPALMDDGGWSSPSSIMPYQHITRARKERNLAVRYSD